MEQMQDVIPLNPLERLSEREARSRRLLAALRDSAAQVIDKADFFRRMQIKLAEGGPGKRSVPFETIRRANGTFDAHLSRRRRKGQRVEVLKGPYHRGLSFVRAVLRVNGIKLRVFFDTQRWRASSRN